MCERHHYRPPTKLREGNVFTPVCHSFQGGRGPPLWTEAPWTVDKDYPVSASVNESWKS